MAVFTPQIEQPIFMQPSVTGKASLLLLIDLQFSVLAKLTNCVNQVKHDKYAFANTFTIRKRLYPNINSMLVYHQCLPFVPEYSFTQGVESREEEVVDFPFLELAMAPSLPSQSNSSNTKCQEENQGVPSLAGG